MLFGISGNVGHEQNELEQCSNLRAVQCVTKCYTVQVFLTAEELSYQPNWDVTSASAICCNLSVIASALGFLLDCW